MSADVTIFEGPDGAGKSTAITQLRLDAQVSHHGPYLGEAEIAHHYLEAMRPAWDRRCSVVLDRSWVSEAVYGVVYRGGFNRITSNQRRILERVAIACRGVIVVCRPRRETVIHNWSVKSAHGKEYLTKVGFVTEVYEVYKELIYAAAYGSLALSLPVVTYDYEQETVDDLRTKLSEERRIMHQRKPRVLIIGACDCPNSTIETVPFAGLDQSGYSAWFNDQLEAAKIDERDLAWANAYSHDGNPIDPGFIAELQPRAIFTLGAVAANWCLKNGVDYMAFHHPRFRKRFHYRDPYPLIKEIKDATGN